MSIRLQACKGAEAATADAEQRAARHQEARDAAEAAQRAALDAQLETAERLRAAEAQTALHQEQRHEVVTLLAERESKVAQVR